MAKITTVVVLVLWGAAGAIGSALPEFPFLCTAGEATLQVPPDVATISFEVTDSDPNSVEGLEGLLEKSREIVDLIKEFHIAPEDSKASDIQKYEVHEDSTIMQEGKLIGYEFRRKFSFRLRNLDSCRQITQKLLRINHVNSINTAFSVTDRKAKEEELMQQAIANARQRAEAIAKGAGAKVVSVYALSEVDMRALDSYFLNPSVGSRGVTGSGRSRADGQDAGFAEADEIIEAMSKPSPITLRASIRVLYKIEPQERP